MPSEEADTAAKTRVVEGIRQGLHPACLGAWVDVQARKVRENTKERVRCAGEVHACVLPTHRYSCLNTPIDIALPPHPSPKHSRSRTLKTPSHPAAMGFSEPLVRDAKHASESKEEGNRFFKATDYESAVDCYTRAVDLCPFGEEHDYARSVYHGNRAQGYLSLSLFEDAVDDCDAAVRLQPRFVKAFMRRAQAKEALGRLEEAVADVKAVLEIDPTIGTARASCERLEAAIKKKNDEMKDEMLGAFTRPSFGAHGCDGGCGGCGGGRMLRDAMMEVRVRDATVVKVVLPSAPGCRRVLRRGCIEASRRSARYARAPVSSSRAMCANVTRLAAHACSIYSTRVHRALYHTLQRAHTLLVHITREQHFATRSRL